MRRLALIALLLWSVPAFAVQPDEVLDNPALEARARMISAGLRCPVCRNENIDESNADISRDIRLMVRDLLVEGKSDEEVVDAIVARYGEFILLNPKTSGSNLILWLAGPAMLLAALGIGYATIRNRSQATPPESLTEDEQARLSEIMKS
ncbi:MAG: cytochrome c-type biogenesis protein CcmH [Rhodobacterales bacterium]|nr:cytochrome c-type biogenesis protein CcmH [Rhodobacterales bacterium]